MKIFLTGTQSFVGTELIAKCDKEGIEVFGCDSAEPVDRRFGQMDIRSKDIVDLIPEGVDAVVHLAALSSNRQCDDNAHECFDVNVMGTLNMIDAAMAKEAKQFIFASSEWVYDRFAENETKDVDSAIDIAAVDTEYSLSKLVSEANLRQKYQHGFCDTTILRFGIIYGVRAGGSAVESVFKSVKEKDEVTVGSLKTGRCFIHVSDIASGIIKSVGLKGFNLIDIQGDALITLADIIETSKVITGRDPVVVESDPSNISVKRVSNKKAKELLGWRPEISLKAGLEMLQSYLEEQKLPGTLSI